MRLDIGLIGATAVAERAMVAPSRRHADATIIAVAASDADRAARFAARHGIRIAHRDYAALIEDRGINAVYISLHNSAHCDWAIRAARAGKHVIVEKPICLDEEEYALAAAAASAAGMRLLEAVVGEGHDWQSVVLSFVADRRYGPLRSIWTRLHFAVSALTGYRARAELGGGIFRDAAPYWLQATGALWALDGAMASGQGDFSGPTGIDTSFSARLSWPDGRESALDAAFAARHVAEHAFVFEHAVVRLRNFLLPVAGPAPLNLIVTDSDGRRDVLSFPAASYFDLQFDRIRVLLTGAVVGDVEERAAGERVRLMAELYRGARRWIGR